MPLETPATQELLPHLLHEISQPVTALQCSLELALHSGRGPESYKHALENAQVITAQLANQVSRTRALAQAASPCTCEPGIDLPTALSISVAETNLLAESLGATVNWNCEPRMVSANLGKLRVAFTHLIDVLLTHSPSSWIYIVDGDQLVGTVHVIGGLPRDEDAENDSLDIARFALESMGYEMTLLSGSDFTVEVKMSSQTSRLQ